MDRCDTCGYSYDELPRSLLASKVRSGATDLARTITHASRDDVRRRPAADVWSPLEYACHVRDVLRVQHERIDLAQREHEPAFVSMRRDERAVEDAYGEQDPATVAGELRSSADVLARQLDALDDAGWARTGVYNFPERAVRTVEWIARHTVHEERHHLADVERGLAHAHWESIWAEHEPNQLSWYEVRPERSLELITAHAPPPASVIDVGGGASTLVDELVDRGYTDVTVLDIAAPALERAHLRLGPRSAAVDWITGDVLQHRFDRTFDLWHDRAAFHFLVQPADRRSYGAAVERALPPGGHLVLATFGPEGPTACSGLPVQRYDQERMSGTLGDAFELVSYSEELHTTPSGGQQQFAYGVYRRI